MFFFVVPDKYFKALKLQPPSYYYWIRYYIIVCFVQLTLPMVQTCVGNLDNEGCI